MEKSKLELLKKHLTELQTIKMKRVIKEPKFLSIETYECTLNNGETIRREKLLKGKKDGSAAVIFAITEDKKFIIAIEPRVFTKETVDVGLPAGYIEEDETAEEGARRELLEETGYEAKDMILLGSYYQDQGCSSSYNHYFIATNCKKIREQKLDEGEFIRYMLVDYEELIFLLNNGYIKGLNSAYTIEKAKEYIKSRSD